LPTIGFTFSRLPSCDVALGCAAMKRICVALLVLSMFAALPVTAADAAAKGKIVHVVAFKYKKAVTEPKQKEIADALVALKKSIPQIISVQHGKNVSKEGFDKGYHDLFIVTFANEKDRDTYLEHPKHKDFAKMLDGLIADKGIFVYDFVAAE
jgi:hypothetical protein